jgi:hypothetical protein
MRHQFPDDDILNLSLLKEIAPEWRTLMVPLFDRNCSSARLAVWPEVMLEALQLSRAVATLEARMAGIDRRRLPHS